MKAAMRRKHRRLCTTTEAEWIHSERERCLANQPRILSGSSTNSSYSRSSARRAASPTSMAPHTPSSQRCTADCMTSLFVRSSKIDRETSHTMDSIQWIPASSKDFAKTGSAG